MLKEKALTLLKTEMCTAFTVLGAYNNAGLVPVANVVAPGLPAPPLYTANQVVSGEACILLTFQSHCF